MDTLIATLAARLGPRGITTDPADMAPWLIDWRGRVHGCAAVLVSPADVAEVAFVVQASADAGVPVVPQGGNTSMVAGATPTDPRTILLSLRRMNAIRTVSAADGVLVAEAGAILSDVHDAAAAAGCRFPLSLAAKGSATVGGLVSTNAGGTQVLRFGPMRALLLGVQAVLPDGRVFEGLSALRKDNRGYDLRQLLAGAEGTLGVVTAAALRLVPAAGGRVVAWAGLSSPHDALALLRRLEATTGEAVESFELIPDAALSLVLRHVPGTRAPLSGAHAWHVLVEATHAPGAPPPAVADALMASGLVEDAVVAATEAQAEALWKLRESISTAERADGEAAKHDVSVPVAAMPAFLIEAAARVEARFPGTRVNAFGHLGDGNIHFNVRAPAGDDGKAWFAGHGATVSAHVHDLVAAAGGSLSAEHGIGRLKLAEFARTADPVRLATLRAIKDALDPAGIMNPGALVPPPDPARGSLAERAARQ
jgi:FAD/FMN-containing dehydrogenase